MDLLRTAVVDITTLISTCHALNAELVGDGLALRTKARRRLQREIKRGTLAYIDVLARAKRGVVDETLVAACRVAAERHMAHALRQQDRLGQVLSSEPGALAGAAAARQDLWRLAHMTIYLRLGLAALRDSGALGEDAEPAGKLAAGLRRRFRKALIAYARTALRTGEAKQTPLAKARQAALAEIGPRGAKSARRLSNIELSCDPKHTVLQLGVSKPLLDLTLDWQRQAAETT